MLGAFILERDGYSVTHLISDGGMGQKLMETSLPPDVMLLDFMLPSLTGLEFVRMVRTTPEWQWIPVILLTADSSSDSMKRARSLGATEYVQKPFAPDRLLMSIHQFLP